LNKVPIDGLKNIFQVQFQAQALAKARGFASGKTEIKTKDGKTSAVGSVRLENLSLNDVDLAYPIIARYTLSEDPDAGVIEIPSARVDLGSTLFLSVVP
jgi:hypothetical protein